MCVRTLAYAFLECKRKIRLTFFDMFYVDTFLALRARRNSVSAQMYVEKGRL